MCPCLHKSKINPLAFNFPPHRKSSSAVAPSNYLAKAMPTFRSLKHKSLFTPKLSSSTTTKTTPRKSPSKMATYIIGKIFILLLFFSMSIYRNVSSTPDTDNSQASPDSNVDTVYGASTQHQQAQIDRLEQLVKNLTELVAKLESHYYDIPRIGKLGESPDFALEDTKVDGSKSNYRERRLGDGEMESEGLSGDEIREGGKLKPSVTKYSTFWSEQFRFVSAVNLDSMATSMIVLPVLDFEGSSKYVAVGDDRGRVYVFLRNGDVLVEFNTSTKSPVTAMISYLSVYKNESVIVTGHSSGTILLHRVWDSSGIDERSSLHMENVVVMDTYAAGGNRSAISILAVHHVGRSRYILSADTAGKIMVFRENGKFHGEVVPMSRPLAFLKQRLLFLTETGAGSLDLRTLKTREVQCEGLNHSAARSYVFDPTERLKAYGFTSAGDLIHVILLGDATNFKCRVRPWKNIDVDEPLAFQVIKGYLLVADQDKLSVYNISSHHFVRSGAPRLVFSSGIEEITSSFLVNEPMNKDLQKKKRVPLIASDREKLVALGFGGGFVGMYRSNLPIMKGESNSMLWTSPVLFFILFLFGAWHFFAKKKEVLTSWGTDDPFTSASVTSSAPLGSSGSSDRSYADLSSRNSDSMDLRGNGFSSSRRYGSPTRYAVGGGNSFRPNSIDTSSRPSVEPNFRGSPDLKFRGSNIESSGYSNRRENLYVNSHVLDESG